MPSIIEPGLDPLINLAYLLVDTALKVLHRLLRILYRIKRLYPFLACSLGFPAFPLSFHLLDVCTVGEHDLTQLYRRRGGKYLSLESIANQIGYPSRMIDMGMSKKYVIDGCCIERQLNTCLFLI